LTEKSSYLNVVPCLYVLENGVGISIAEVETLGIETVWQKYRK
jgi:hypothetical protein